MGKESKIEWCDATWNPWYGCHKVSPGCAYCYMDRWAGRSGRDPEKVTRAKDGTFLAPLKWKEPKRIFTCSLSDFFIEEADRWRGDVYKVIAETSWHTYLILTKRIERTSYVREILDGKEYPNVWLGVSVENQRQADDRIPQLLQIPAAKHFVSIEPLLSPIDLRCVAAAKIGGGRFGQDVLHQKYQSLDWVIVGGESGGPEYRRLVAPHYYKNKIDHWFPKSDALKQVRSLRDQCQAAGVPFFFKQWGGPLPHSGGSAIDGREWKEIPG